MTSFSSQFNPRANVFIMVNLGCEMLFVIDQRLKAQQIALDKSIQVIHDVTAVLLEPKFIDSLIVGSTQPNAQLLTEDHCKFMLKDMATCSLMRLDDVSMDKLWNLMTMVYKWQLYQTKQQHHLIDITFRHLQAIGNIHIDEKRSMLIDFTKNTLLDFWNSFNDEEQLSIYNTNKAWLELFNTKISLLIRLGFQNLDGTFNENIEAIYYQDFKESIGDNIYIKSSEIADLQKLQQHRYIGDKQTKTTTSTKCVNQLAEMLNIPHNTGNPNTSTSAVSSDDFQPINIKEFQKNFEQNLLQCNILFQDFDVNSEHAGRNSMSVTSEETEEFVHLQPFYNNKQQIDENNSRQTTSATYALRQSSSNAQLPLIRIEAVGNRVLSKDLIDLYIKVD